MNNETTIQNQNLRSGSLSSLLQLLLSRHFNAHKACVRNYLAFKFFLFCFFLSTNLKHFTLVRKLTGLAAYLGGGFLRDVKVRGSTTTWDYALHLMKTKMRNVILFSL